MKFRCGESRKDYIKRMGQWHRWFAWYPVRVGENDCRWLEFVWRLCIYRSEWGDVYWDTYYKPIEVKPNE